MPFRWPVALSRQLPTRRVDNISRHNAIQRITENGGTAAAPAQSRMISLRKIVSTPTIAIELKKLNLKFERKVWRIQAYRLAQMLPCTPARAMDMRGSAGPSPW